MMNLEPGPIADVLALIGRIEHEVDATYRASASDDSKALANHVWKLTAELSDFESFLSQLSAGNGKVAEELAASASKIGYLRDDLKGAPSAKIGKDEIRDILKYLGSKVDSIRRLLTKVLASFDETSAVAVAALSANQRPTKRGGQALPDLAVYLSESDPKVVAGVLDALHQIYAEQGLVLEIIGKPIISSWFGRFRARSQEALTSPQFVDRLKKVEAVIEQTQLRAPMAAENVAQSQAVANLLHAIGPLESAAILSGSVLLVKVRQGVFTLTLTAAQRLLIESEPTLLKDPALALERLEALQGGGISGQGHVQDPATARSSSETPSLGR